MRRLAKDGSTNIAVRQRAVQLTRFLPQKDFSAEIAALFDFVQNRIRYVRDVQGVETLHTAERVLINGAGDCDDKSVLLAALLLSIGYPARFVAVGFKNPNACEHVFVQTRAPGGPWFSLDATMPNRMGWAPLGDPKLKKAIYAEI